MNDNMRMTDDVRAATHDQTWLEKGRNPDLLWDLIADLFDSQECWQLDDFPGYCQEHDWDEVRSDRPCPHGRVRVLVSGYCQELSEALAATQAALEATGG